MWEKFDDHDVSSKNNEEGSCMGIIIIIILLLPKKEKGEHISSLKLACSEMYIVFSIMGIASDESHKK